MPDLPISKTLGEAWHFLDSRTWTSRDAQICSSCYRRGLKLRKQMAAADPSVELGRGEEVMLELL